jgi:uncharacterized protein YciI
MRPSRTRASRLVLGTTLGLAALIAGGCEGMDQMFREDRSGSGYAANNQPLNQPAEEPRLDSGFGGASTPGAGTSSSRGVRVSNSDRNVYVVRMTPGSAWRAGTPTADQPGYDRHLDTLRRWSAQDIVVLGGPVISDQGTLIIIRAASLDDARELAESDPAVQAGLFIAEVDQMAAQFPGRN